MVKYIDNGFLVGWYFVKEDLTLGDGTKETAYRIQRERRKYEE